MDALLRQQAAIIRAIRAWFDDHDFLEVHTPVAIAAPAPELNIEAPRLSLKQVSEQIGQRIKKGTLVVVESTVAPGTTQNVVQKIIEGLRK